MWWVGVFDNRNCYRKTKEFLVAVPLFRCPENYFNGIGNKYPGHFYIWNACNIAPGFLMPPHFPGRRGILKNKNILSVFHKFLKENFFRLMQSRIVAIFSITNFQSLINILKGPFIHSYTKIVDLTFAYSDLKMRAEAIIHYP